MLQPDAAARVKGGKDRREIAAKVLVRRPSSFPGIKEPTQPGGVPRSEAKALLECRRLVPPAGGRLLQGMEELCPGAVPCTALPIARGWRRCALELCPALPCRRSRRSGAQAMPPAAAGLPAQPLAAGLEQLRASASIGNQMDLSGEQGSSAKRTSQGWEPATGTAVGTDKGQPAAPQPGAALDGPPEMPQRPGHAPAPAQKDPENPAGPRQCRHGGAAEQRGQPFPGPTSQSSPAPPACVPPAPNPCPSSRSPAASSSLKARAMCPQRH
ncbi:translation initiation factor IF-2-like isoform X2 [Manacus candei]|uniref:translation initiation factor IF-2-like isoform X2 n=1 Tax=Manacus candei TaxID=415023 RepID=UPI00222679D7|nr:translation initiation factor IF-2-like isoform X2 [Manacus candei]